MAHLSKVAVWDDPSCSITYFDTRDMEKYGYSNEEEFISWYTQRLKAKGSSMEGFNFIMIPSSDVPKDRSQRREWSLIDGKVKVDPVKVSKKEAKLAAKN